MDYNFLNAWFVPLLLVLWTSLLCGMTLRGWSSLISRLIVTLLLLISWFVYTPIWAYFLALTATAIAGRYSSIGTSITLSMIASGLTLVWIAHFGALVITWGVNTERTKVFWALVFPAGWLLIGLGYLLWQIGARVS